MSTMRQQEELPKDSTVLCEPGTVLQSAVWQACTAALQSGMHDVHKQVRVDQTQDMSQSWRDAELHNAEQLIIMVAGR